MCTHNTGADPGFTNRGGSRVGRVDKVCKICGPRPQSLKNGDDG